MKAVKVFPRDLGMRPKFSYLKTSSGIYSITIEFFGIPGESKIVCMFNEACNNTASIASILRTRLGLDR